VSDQNANVAQSVRQRLLNLARQTGQDYNRLLVRYSLERILYRLSQSEHADRFILKGAMLFAVWSGQQYRSTQDLDLLATGDNSLAGLEELLREVCAVETGVPDGMAYAPETVTAEIIREDMQYEGVRLRIESALGTARIPLIIDVGFGDAVTPAPLEKEFPVLLDAPAPRIKAYPRESVIAEKLEAMVSLGEANSRMKDFADVYFLSKHFDFDGAVLAQAIAGTFARRGTTVVEAPAAFTEEFAGLDHKQAQWRAFLRRAAPQGIPDSFADVVAGIATFLGPIMSHLAASQPIPHQWQAPGPWQF
jgi:predicted nucleotidyltransferase component of viral defense system